MSEMEQPTREQRELLANYWWRRAISELTSWVGFQHVLADLRHEDAVTSVIELAERAVDDEYKHTQRCRAFALHFGHADEALSPRGEKPLSFRGATEAQNRLLRITLCAFSESIGCLVLRHARPLLEWPELLEFNRENLADEVRHSRVGWGHLATVSDETRLALRPWIPVLLGILHASWCETGELEREDLIPFGYFSARLLEAAYQEAVESVIWPGVIHLGIGRAA